FWHGNVPGRPRLHSLREAFLPRYREIREAAQQSLSGCEVSALSPQKRLQFRQAAQHKLGRFLAPAVNVLFLLMARPQFSWLARTAINPFLVVRITKAQERRAG